MSRMIFPFEEPEPAYRWAGNLDFFPDYMGALEYWGAPKYFPPEEPTYVPYVISAGGGAASKLVGCPVVMDFEDGRRSPGTITGVGDVKYDHGELLSYVLTVEESPRSAPTVVGRTHGQSPMPTDPKVAEWMQPLRFERKRVVQRASPGLRKPRPVDGVAFGWDRSRGMYSEKTSVKPQSFDSWWKSFEESQFSWLGAF